MAKLLGRIVPLCAGLWAAGGMMDAEMQRTQVRVSYQPKDSQSGVFVFFPTPVLWGLSFADCGRVRASDLDRMAVLFPWPWPGAGQPPSLCARFRCFTFPSSTLPPPAPGAGWFWAQPWPTERSPKNKAVESQPGPFIIRFCHTSWLIPEPRSEGYHP